MDAFAAVAIISAVIGVALIIYFFYVLCDIRDTLQEIRDKFFYGEEKEEGYINNGAKTVDMDSLPQKTCPRCGDRHDFDYPKCPRCKYVYTQ